jgi:O-antigen ligase
VEGRLSAGGRYSNANDLAWTLLIGLIFLGFLFLRGKRINKAVAILLMIPVLIAIAKTGSRTALLGAGMLFLYVFFQASASAKARLIIATPVLLFALLLVVPSQLRERYTTLFRTQSMTTAQVEASGSSAARLELLKDSITMTIMHPLVGVGPGNFMVAQQNLALARGEPFGLWHVTHNTYTELSSEMGIPGLAIYVIFLFQCWKTLAIILRRRGVSEEVLLMAQTLRAALVVLATVAFFDSYGYNANIPILAGLITALSFIAHSQRIANKIASKSVENAPSLPEPAFEPAWSGSPY